MIQLEHLYFSYTGREPWVLDDLNLTIADGEYLSILGENGSGKSTLLRLLLRLLHPSRGKIVCDCGTVGYVPQRSDGLNAQFPITVGEMLGAYRRLLHLSDRAAVDAALHTVHMESFRHELIGNLSGGQRQRVFIARALMGRPGLLVLDEPSTGVDVGSQREIYALIRYLNRERGLTVISVEHNLAAAMENSTLIYHLAGGGGHLCTPTQYEAEFLGAEKKPYSNSTQD